ncbi:MAG: alpha/beta hydrolase [Gammaproteobacteria bacterium]|nr:alpha/beta hydrolase [Gammaproteobacteria bacterium]
MRIIRRLLLGLVTLLLVAWVGLVVYAYWPTGIEEVPARELAGPNDRFVSVDGLELRYQEFGTARPGEPSFVLIHGFGNSLQSFRLLAPLLGERFRTVTVDMPGFGLSAKPVDWDYKNPNQARMMTEFMRELDLENVIVGGHSLGGAIALRVALTEPRVRGLVLMNPGIIETGVPRITEYQFFPLQRLSAKQFGNREFRERFLKTSFVDPAVVTDEVMDNLMLVVRSEGYMAGTTSMMGQYEAAAEATLLGDVHVPTLIAWGEQDRRKTPQELADLQAGLSGSPAVDTIQVASAGHYVHEEAPQILAAGMISAAEKWILQ